MCIRWDDWNSTHLFRTPDKKNDLLLSCIYMLTKKWEVEEATSHIMNRFNSVYYYWFAWTRWKCCKCSSLLQLLQCILTSILIFFRNVFYSTSRVHLCAFTHTLFIRHVSMTSKWYLSCICLAYTYRNKLSISDGRWRAAEAHIEK